MGVTRLERLNVKFLKLSTFKFKLLNLGGSCKSKKITESVILSETKNLMLSMRYKALHSVQGDRRFIKTQL